MDGRMLGGLISLIEFVGGLIVAGYCLLACGAVLRERRPETARYLVATGALLGLNFKLAATLLKTLFVTSGSQLAMLAVVVGLRVFLKWTFARERGGLPGASR